LALYLKHFQHVSYQRLERLFSDIFGLKIGQGGLGTLLRRSKPALDAEKALILQNVRQADAVASDEPACGSKVSTPSIGSFGHRMRCCTRRPSAAVLKWSAT
jgi:hypothetical protein